MTKKLPTIKLQGNSYTLVKDRVLGFHELHPQGSIITEESHKEDGSYAWFKAIVTPDCDKPGRFFIGRSAGPVDEQKSYEKLETVAVGRALAFLGIGVLEGIASADEIEKFVKTKEKGVKKNPITDITLQDGSVLRTGISPKSNKRWWGHLKNGQMKFFENEDQYRSMLPQLEEPKPPEFPLD